MTKSRKIFLMAISILVLISVSLMAKQVWLKGAIPVKVVKASMKDIRQTVSSSGSIEAKNKVQVACEMAGRVKAVYFKEQDKVKKGQLLARLVDDEIAAQLDQARAAFLQAEISLKNMEKNVKRAQELYKKGFLSLEGMETAQVEYDMGCELLSQRKASYEAVKARLNSALITAPITGTVIKKFIREGEIVAGPLSASRISEPVPIAEIADLTEMEVSTDIDETEIAKIQHGQDALIKVDAYPDKILKGKVREIALVTSERKEAGRNYRVNVSLLDTPEWLRLGMTSTIDFIIHEKKGVLCVPVEAVLQKENRSVVFMVKEGKIIEREVKVGIGDEEYLEISSGLSPGEEVVIGDLTKFYQGERVKTVNSLKAVNSR
jgi:HlyD family secretion protein